MKPEQAADALRRVTAELESKSTDLATVYAEAVLDKAQRTAGLRPTPQARMASTGLRVERGSIVGDGSTTVSGSGGSATLADVLWGSERGSSIYRQFGPPTGGAWIEPATTDPGPEATEAGEGWLRDVIGRAV